MAPGRVVAGRSYVQPVTRWESLRCLGGKRVVASRRNRCCRREYVVGRVGDLKGSLRALQSRNSECYKLRYNNSA